MAPFFQEPASRDLTSTHRQSDIQNIADKKSTSLLSSDADTEATALVSSRTHCSAGALQGIDASALQLGATKDGRRS